MSEQLAFDPAPPERPDGDRCPNCVDRDPFKDPPCTCCGADADDTEGIPY